MNSKSEIGGSDEQKVAALKSDVADLLFSMGSPVRDLPEFESILSENARLVKGQADLTRLFQRILETVPSVERAESGVREASKHLASEKKELAGYAKELGEAAFEGFQGGELEEHSRYSGRKELQRRIDDLQKQQAELTVSKDTGMIQKAKIQALRLKLVGQRKIEEFKIASQDKAIGEAILQSKEEVPCLCPQTESIVERIIKQRENVAVSKEKLNEAEDYLSEQLSDAAKILDCSEVVNSEKLKSEHNGIQEKLRQNKLAIAEGGDLLVSTALETPSLLADKIVGEKLMLLIRWQAECDVYRSQAMHNHGVKRTDGLQGLSLCGGVLIIIGLVLIGYAMFFMNTTVSVPGGLSRVHNIGLQQNRLMYLVIGLVGTLFGGGAMAVDILRRKLPMSENPYQSRSAEPQVVGVKSGSREDLRSVAKYQKGILVCMLIYVITIYASMMIPYAAYGIEIVGLVGTVFVFLLAIKVYNIWVGVLLVILALVPCIGLLVLLVVNGKATAVLKQNGIKVGLLGANLSQI